MLFGLTGQARMFLYAGPADMRKGFDGLSGLVINKLKQNPLSGDIFIFINRQRTLIKLLVWDQTGFAIWHKRLEQGTFEMPSVDPSSSSVEINRQKLMLILEGISLKNIHVRKRFSSEKIMQNK
ncbi:MAG: IS66 family insertion sequence element accessory protein TnpB [Bacteroidia bacterium]|nr:IS66 family insertion sequence element accessory protein TnpB [Bacteroidia bacterium]